MCIINNPNCFLPKPKHVLLYIKNLVLRAGYSQRAFSLDDNNYYFELKVNKKKGDCQNKFIVNALKNIKEINKSRTVNILCQ